MNNFNNIRNQPIGVFDSGIGGLTVLAEIERLMPGENIIYFGDTARVPYGNKTSATVKKFSVENVLFLLEERVKMVVVACNTSSALALDYLNNIFRIPIIGVIESGVNKALAVTSGKIGIIGTKATIESRAYQRNIAKKNKKIKIFSKSCPLFVPLVEEGLVNGEITKKTIQMYLESFKKKKIDTIILGCTHYPLLKEEIAKYLQKVNIVDSAQEVASHAKDVLGHFKLISGKKAKGNNKFCISDEPKNFTNFAKLFLKRNIPEPKIVNV
ncbi:MAG: glutamate racemase [Candidatus Omnitrophica bacterium]|nr:glutamate racemase [Candidatus Omnitrophota bacterium]MCF7877478.1 glutamate racemase [Candidatus Omnitrophota bacterium]MCF7878379.1 glutamate racemase [Candidatus Omnitrophota bacterium]MCF7892837.1 glutamate racemase [Candidatus Omnitrophota bacterium]